MIFDLDGTLVDSEPPSYRALLDLLPDLDEDAGELMERYRGLGLASVLADIEERLNKSLPADFEQRYRARVDARFSTELKPMPGAATMLAALRLPRGIASSGPMAKIRGSLTLTGLDRFFGSRLFSSYEIGSWKPEPDLHLHAAAAMGFAPAHCFAVEDSDVGITAALAAGMKAVLYDPTGRSGTRDGVTIIRELGVLNSSLDRSEPPHLP